MKEERLENMALPLSKLEPKLFRNYFTSHLDRLYSAKLYTIKRLPELANLAHFSDLRNSILEVCDEVAVQISRMEKIYQKLSLQHTDVAPTGWQGLIDDAIAAVAQESSVELRDLSILYYMHALETLEVASFKLMQLAAERLEDDTIGQLLKENYDEAKADRGLILQVISKYVAG